MDSDILRVWQLVHELSDQLALNQKITATLQAQTGSLKTQAAHASTGFALRRFNVDISKEIFESELERTNAQLIIENQTLLHENKQLSLLLKEYEGTMETIMAKFRNHALAAQQHELTLTRHYETLLNTRETQVLSADLASSTEMTLALQRLSHHLRGLLRTMAGENPDPSDPIYDGNTHPDDEAGGFVDLGELEHLLEALDERLGTEGRGDWAQEREIEIERLERENEMLRAFLEIDGESIAASGVSVDLERADSGRYPTFLSSSLRRNAAGSEGFGSPQPGPGYWDNQQQPQQQAYPQGGGAPLQRAVDLQPGMRMGTQGQGRRAVLALTRALPLAPIPLHHLFHFIRIGRPSQAPSLYRRLRYSRPEHDGASDDEFNPAFRVRHISVETWEVDADVLINLLRLLPNLESVNLWVGASNFSPEHLEDVFKLYMPKLRYLSIRFRPYVRKATYYQFHKGSYFDSTLLALSSWPSSSEGLTTLSIVQDPFTPDPSDATQRFAQPIVFFRLDLHLSLLIHSQAASASLKSLRIRIPSRPIAQPLTVAYMDPSHRDASPIPRVPPPSIEFLDISTSGISVPEIETLLARFKDLKHLILDACTGLLRGGSPQALGRELGWWSDLGKRIAMAGVKKARDREKELKTWYEALVRASSNATLDEPAINAPGEPRRQRRGRRGLATATISIRGSTSPPRAVPSTSAVSAAAALSTTRGRPLVVPKVHIVPTLPSLRTLSLFPTSTENIPARVSPEARERILAAFEKGWNDGIRVIWEKRTRMGTSFLREPAEGVARPRFLKFREGREDEWGEQEEGMQGLEDVKVGDEEIFFRLENSTLELGQTPVLCLCGSSVDLEGHAGGCGHAVAREIWRDTL
ncbi:hypothetical protein LshimejAT787_1400190 [Lyophyllum shimeji]|uniref:Uncharacterized protein n=1 Tax=Lyophyllum shimeji TaxID=47721 RepID=A0A9P3PV61_LYOSH|nr:hypothetical protein LshimejAT787_1400190 [Lyophyllum shimeji]